MGILDFFRRRNAIGDLDALADFIDAQSAFLAQKGVYEYARARAGPYANALFQEEAFFAAVEVSRWQAFPLALIMVGEALEGVFRRHAGDDAATLRDALIRLLLSVFDRYPVPAAIGQETWASARAEIERELNGAGLHPPKPTLDIPEPYAQRYFGLMPIHEDMRSQDLPTTHSYLKVTLTNIVEQFRRRADVPALASQLAASVAMRM